MKRKFILSLLFVFINLYHYSTFAKNVNGFVFDKSSSKPIPNSNILLWNKTNSYNAISDSSGYFTIKDVLIGTYYILVSNDDYYIFQQNGIEINSGIELSLDIPLKEKIVSLKEVEVNAFNTETKTSNAFLQYIKVENLERYSGVMNDPINFLKNFASVSNVDEGRNLISIRGGSPYGVQYKIENMPVLPPLHFSSIGITGGNLTMLNINYLNNYDFLIGSFESNNGNALSGLIDINLKKINNTKTQGTFGFTINGFELGLEGKFSKKSRANYFLSYRYSFIDLLNKAIKLFDNRGIGDSIPNYQDFSFKVNIPYSLKGNISLWGIIGPSDISYKFYNQFYNDYNDKTRTESKYNFLTGLFGINLQHRFNDNFQGKFYFGTSLYNFSGLDLIFFDKNPTLDYGKVKEYVNTINTGADFTYKLNVKNDFQFGTSAEVSFLFMKGIYRPYIQSVQGTNYNFNTIEKYLDGKKTFPLIKGYFNYKHYFTKDFTINSGVYGQIFTYNNSFSIEPRLNVQYTLKEKNIFSITAGLHSQTQILKYFIFTDVDNNSNNDNLDLNRSFQTSLNYRRIFNDKFSLSTSIYYHYHYNIAVDKDDPLFSILNSGSSYALPYNVTLNNKGLGENYGIELDLRMNNLKGFYGTMATTYFSSRFAGSDGVWRSTYYDLTFTFKLNVGYELKLGKKVKTFINTKVAYAGGNKITPFDFNANNYNNTFKLQIDKGYTERLPDYFTWNLNFGITINSKKLTHTFMLDIQNLTQNLNVYKYYADYNEKKIKYVNQFSLNIPIIYYKINF